MEGFIWIVWFGLCIWVGVAANNKGRSGIGWAILAFIFSPLIVGVILACMKDLKVDADVNRVRMEQQHLKDRVVSNEKLTEYRLNRVESDVSKLSDNRTGGVISNMSQNTKMLSDDTRICPACAEVIKAAAIKCKHCGSMFDEIKLIVCPFCKEDTPAIDSICKHCNSNVETSSAYTY